MASPLHNPDLIFRPADAPDPGGSRTRLLSGDEMDAALRRGLTGFEWLSDGVPMALPGGTGDARLAGQAMTLALRLDLPAHGPKGALLSQGDEPVLERTADALAFTFRTTPLAERVQPDAADWARRLAASGQPWCDLAEGRLRISAPMERIGAGRRDVLVRYASPHLQLWVDGALVDEEWPHGDLLSLLPPLQLGPAATGVEYVAVWARALADEEIIRLAGGRRIANRRTRDILGPERPFRQYWAPRGHNTSAGDCMPFFDGERFHLFWLYDRRHHASRWTQGAHQYAHFSTADLVRWEEHPMAVPLTAPWECAMGTGDIIRHEGVTHIFYTDCGSRCEYADKPARGAWIYAATSRDGIHFEKDHLPIVPGHDCDVFQDPETGRFHLVRGGGNRLESDDLRHWTDVPGDFVERGPDVSEECPNHFSWGGRHYFILGRCAVWTSRHATGPWEPLAPDLYDGLYVPKAAPYRDGRCLLAGWLGGPGYGWGGHLALREMVQGPDGSLGTRFLPELMPACGAVRRPKPTPISGVVRRHGDGLLLRGGDGQACAALEEVAPRTLLTLTVSPRGAAAFGLAFGGSGAWADNCELRFDPATGSVQFGTPADGGPAPDSLRPPHEGHDFAIRNVTGLDRPFTLEVILRDDLVDVCIGGRRTMISRRAKPLGQGRAYLFARGGGVEFRNLAVRRLKD